MENQAPRRQSQRQRRNPDRLQLGEGVRAGQELPWQQMARLRYQNAARNAERRAEEREAIINAARGQPQAPQEPPAAPDQAPPVAPVAPVDARPPMQIIKDHQKYARRDKACNELTYFKKIQPRLTTALLALYHAAPSELSKFFMNDADFVQFVSELNDYHSLNFPCDQNPISILSEYTSDLVRDLRDPFLFRFTVDPPVFSISQFLREFFKNSLVSDRFLLKLAIFCMPEAVNLKPDFVVGVLKSVLADAEVESQKARFLCQKCYLTFYDESQLLSHTGNHHNWALTVNMTEENSAAARNRLFLFNMAKWTTAAAHRALVCDTDNANAHFARYREIEIQGIVNGEPHGSKALLSALAGGFNFDDQFTPNLPEE